MKTVTHIEVPKRWLSKDDWDSHRELIYLALSKTDRKPFTEFGCGLGSTPLLKNYCHNDRRLFFSYETNREWASKFKDVTVMNDYDEIHLSDGNFKQGILFIDSAPGDQRKELIKKHANHANIIIVHDTEPGAEYVYGMSNILSSFKYQLNYTPKGKPHTTAVSNFVNVEEWI